ncbi:hypothetical protein GCM10022252_75330 [Streptosporangium oxazolinicum]|uniref:Uncharacterized protein n=1 Tax=Streptosporangium oxazolinicum TaxID=909287 RepID=A0ABP8BKT9_9ACTN
MKETPSGTAAPRKASRSITVFALAALSLSLVAACADEPETPPVTADCVVKQPDGSYKAVDDKLCDNPGGAQSAVGFWPVWIYGGSYDSRTHRVTGGSKFRPLNTNINARSGRVITSGFGSSAKGGGGS